MAWQHNPLLIQFRRQLVNRRRPLHSSALPMALWAVFLWWSIHLLGLSPAGNLEELIWLLILCGAVSTITSLGITTWRLRSLHQTRVFEDLAVTPMLSREITLGVFLPIWYSQFWVWAFGLLLVGFEVGSQVLIEQDHTVGVLFLLLVFMTAQSALAAAVVLHHWLRDCSEWKALGKAALMLVALPWGLALMCLFLASYTNEFIAILTWPLFTLGLLIWQGLKPLHAIQLIDELSDVDHTIRWWQRAGGVEKEKDGCA